MTLSKEFFERDTNITAKVICDSVSEQGDRITTLEIEYPRFILGELNTHRMLSKNSSSSRAIPVKEMIKQVAQNMAQPISWGAAQSGMQAGDEIEAWGDFGLGWVTWVSAMEHAQKVAYEFAEMGYHKQIANRVIEPFQMMKTVITGTDWDNFFNLRLHPASQPEFCMLAYKIYQAMQNSKPNLLKHGEWHLPYVETFRRSNDTDEEGTYNGELFYGRSAVGKDGFNWVVEKYTQDQAQRISASCCAQISYRKNDDSLEKANKIFDMLINADTLHASPFEHLATPIRDQSNNVNGWDLGITHSNREGKLFSGNLQGWISYRHLLPNNTCNKFDYEERMKTFG